MIRVLTYSVLLIVGMVLSQLPAIDHLKPEISALTMIFLAYIMIQVGMEFEIDKTNLRKYGVDYLVAMAAAAVPWLTAAAYFWWFFQIGTAESLLIGRFAAPTSAGILFTMLAAAGLAATWTYKKARVLAIFDDLDTVLLMIPLKMMLLGFTLKLLGLGIVVVGLLAVAYYMIHWLRVPTNNFWVAGYAALVWGSCFAFDYVTELHLEVCCRLWPWAASSSQIICMVRKSLIRTQESRRLTTGSGKTCSIALSKDPSCYLPAWRFRRFNLVRSVSATLLFMCSF
jgi:hypothetical protein